VRVTYDAEVDAAYIYLESAPQPGSAVTTLSLDPREVNGEVNIDLDFEGRIIGIEVLEASRLLPAGFVQEHAADSQFLNLELGISPLKQTPGQETQNE
jgi:uncharacterized protein YuzE